jgi:hypothetical protein
LTCVEVDPPGLVRTGVYFIRHIYAQKAGIRGRVLKVQADAAENEGMH